MPLTTAACAAAMLLLSLTAAATDLAKWPDSTVGIHTILIGDGSDTDAQISALAKQGAAPDFIWGGGLRWKPISPKSVSTKYVAFTHDPTNNYNYTWWKETHPTWILYRCDRKTFAFKCFPPAPCDPPVPIDITNPEVVEFQMKNGVLPAKAEGYQGIAWDNFNLGDSIKVTSPPP